MIANISSSVLTTGMQNRNNNPLYRNGIVNSCHQNRCQQSRKCSKQALTCIIGTVVPIVITSLLLCGFMTQKSNLHEYAIYTFVLFCLAFIFPFVVFFFTVVLNKIFHFFKPLNNDSEQIQRISEGNQLTSDEHNHSYCRRGLDEEYGFEPYYLALNYSHLNYNCLSPDQQIPIEDNPPSYEMALLCPTVQLSHPIDITIENALHLEEKNIK